jgi:hypothetical protein
LYLLAKNKIKSKRINIEKVSKVKGIFKDGAKSSI